MNSYFALSQTVIDHERLRKRLFDPFCGGFVSFEGWIRNHNENRAVEKLFYEAYPQLAQSTGEQIIHTALENYDIKAAICVHRLGLLELGGMAVWVGVTGAHRGPCFEACRYIIDAVKADVAIWKLEHYANAQPATWLANSESRLD